MLFKSPYSPLFSIWSVPQDDGQLKPGSKKSLYICTLQRSHCHNKRISRDQLISSHTTSSHASSFTTRIPFGTRWPTGSRIAPKVGFFTSDYDWPAASGKLYFQREMPEPVIQTKKDGKGWHSHTACASVVPVLVSQPFGLAPAGGAGTCGAEQSTEPRLVSSPRKLPVALKHDSGWG